MNRDRDQADGWEGRLRKRTLFSRGAVPSSLKPSEGSRTHQKDPPQMKGIRIVHRIDVFEIEEVQPILHLWRAFAPGMNILTERDAGGTGKTTILDCASAATTGRWPVEARPSMRSPARVIADP